MVLIFGLIACAEPVPEDATLHAIGDSILDWHVESGESVPEVAAEALGTEVYNAAVGGATLTGGGPESIPNQYVEGSWEWVIVDGGGNDLNDGCACGDCDALMDELITADASGGVIVELVDTIAASGAQVAFMGYPELPPTAEFGFDRCGEELVEHRARLEALAAADPAVLFVDAADVVRADQLELYDEDHVHPSVEGARVMGEYIAEAIQAAR